MVKKEPWVFGIGWSSAIKMFLMHVLTKPRRRRSAQLSRISVPNPSFISGLKVSLEVFRIHLLPGIGKLIISFRMHQYIFLNAVESWGRVHGQYTKFGDDSWPLMESSDLPNSALYGNINLRPFFSHRLFHYNCRSVSWNSKFRLMRFLSFF